MLFQLRVLIRTRVLPPACLLLLGFAGLWLARRHRRLGMSLIAASLAALWLLSTPWVADGLARMADHYPALSLSHPSNARAIVILGGGGYRAFAPAGVQAPREHGIQRYLPLAAGLQRSYAAIYEILAEHVSAMLMALRLRNRVG